MSPTLTRQVGLVNEPLPDPLVVVVEDDQGRPISGVNVQWTVGGGGSVDRSEVPSGPDGRSAVQRVLGSATGQVTTTAEAGDLPEVVFTSTAEAGSAPSVVIATQPPGAAVNEVPFDRQPVIQLDNGTGHPGDPGIAVTASVEGATLEGTTVAESDPSGVAQFTDLGLSGEDGSYTLTFAAPGYVSAQSSAIALSSTPSGNGRLVIVTQPSSAVENGEPLAEQPVVRAEDAGGSPLGAGTAITASVSTATLAGTITVETDAEGVATFTDLTLSGLPVVTT